MKKRPAKTSKKIKWPNFFLGLFLFAVIIAIYIVSFKGFRNTPDEVRPVSGPAQVELTQREKDINYFYAVKAFNDGNYEVARNQLNVVTQTDPTRYVAYYLLGHIEKRDKNYSRASDDFQRYLSGSNPNDTFRLSARLEFGYVCLWMKDCNSALQDVNDAKKETGQNIDPVLGEKLNSMYAAVSEKCGSNK